MDSLLWVLFLFYKNGVAQHSSKASWFDQELYSVKIFLWEFSRSFRQLGRGGGDASLYFYDFTIHVLKKPLIFPYLKETLLNLLNPFYHWVVLIFLQLCYHCLLKITEMKLQNWNILVTFRKFHCRFYIYHYLLSSERLNVLNIITDDYSNILCKVLPLFWC